MVKTNTRKVKEAEDALKGVEAKLRQSEQELASTVFERDALQTAINTKAIERQLVKIHIDGLIEVEQSIGPGEFVTFHHNHNGHSFHFNKKPE